MDNAQVVMEPNENVENQMLHDSSTDVHPMTLLLQEIEQSLLEPEVGDIRQGVIMDIRPNELLVDIGYKSEGLVSGREIDRIDSFDSLEVGDEIPVYIMREDRDGTIFLSISRAQAEQDWQRAEDLLENEEIFEGEVAAHNRGGVIIKLGQVRGFVPASQLASRNGASDGDEENRWAHMLGENLKLKVIDLDRKRNRLILSERLAMRDWRRQQKEKLLGSMKEGDVFEGVISSIADFGAFVDLGGADGLIHLSELSWNRVAHPSEVVSIGEEVNVQILSVDRERRRIGLSLRRLQPQPWDVVDENYEVGQIVRGKITKLVNFGAFARLADDGIEGLIHISELSDNRVGHPKEIVTEGEEYDLRIIRIDTDRRRMGLSLKQALPQNQVELDWQIAPSDSGISGADEDDVSELVAEVTEFVNTGGTTTDGDDLSENDSEIDEITEIAEATEVLEAAD